MVVTTLIPTALHLVLGLANFWAQESGFTARAVDALQNPPAGEPVYWSNKITRQLKFGKVIGWIKALLAISVGLIVIYLIWRAYGSFVA